MPQGRFLIIRGGAIGDFILTLPVFQAVRSHFPDAGIDVLGYPRIAELAVASGLAGRARSIESPSLARFFAPDAALDPEWSSYFSQFDVIISFLYDPDEIFKTNVERCTEGQFIAGPHRPKEDGHLHATEVFLKPLERMAVFGPDPTPRLAIPDHGSSPYRGGDWLAVHPGSGSERKNWPEGRWQALLQRLQEATRLRFVLIGGEAENGKIQRMAAKLDSKRVRVELGSALSVVARCLQNCRVFMGHDSGITHLAAALGLPVIVFWGDTNLSVWRPKSQRLHMIQCRDGLEALSLEVVWRVLFRDAKGVLSDSAGGDEGLGH